VKRIKLTIFGLTNCLVCPIVAVSKDNTGVPHILEHSVLCGSRRYPVKEPFVEMLNGSLNTFLNAMTGADRTMYPVASMNKQDFFNLANVRAMGRLQEVKIRPQP